MTQGLDYQHFWVPKISLKNTENFLCGYPKIAFSYSMVTWNTCTSPAVSSVWTK